MEEEKKEQGRGIIVLDEGIDANAAGDAVRAWFCCWGNFMPIRIW
jgi:hypothetical protein